MISRLKVCFVYSLGCGLTYLQSPSAQSQFRKLQGDNCAPRTTLRPLEYHVTKEPSYQGT